MPLPPSRLLRAEVDMRGTATRAAAGGEEL